MNQNLVIVNASRSVRLLHLALAGGLAAVSVVFVVLVKVLRGPLGGEAIPSIAFAAVSVTQIAVALLFFRRRIPSRPFDQSVEAYWSVNAVRSSAIVLWALLGGAGLFAAVGYVLTGALAPGAAVLVALFALITASPSRLEDAGAA